MLETSDASVNSALQRARKTVEERLPEQSQQETMRELGEDGVREVVDAYVDAWQSGDVDAVVGMLTEDAVFSMPPMATWFGGPTAATRRWPPSCRTARSAASGAGIRS